MQDEVSSNESEVTFSAEQQAIFDREIARTKREGEQAVEAMRERGADLLRSSKGETDAEKFLQDRIAQENADAVRFETLKKFFSDAKECGRIAKQDLKLYQDLKREFQALGGLGGIPLVAPKTGGSHSFRPNNK